MNEKFLNEFIVRIADKFDCETLSAIKAELSIHLSDYTVSKRCVEIVPYDYMPDCVKVYLVARKIEGVKMSTLNQYKLRLTQFFTTLRKKIEDITANDVRIFLYNMQTNTNMSNRTLDGVRSIISTFFKWANAEGYVPTNPCITIKPIKYNRKPRVPLDSIELECVRNACENIRDRAMIEFFYSTGCRVSELLILKKDDVDFANGEVMLFGKGEKYRKSYLTPKAKMYLNNYLHTRDDSSQYLFVSMRNPHNKLTKAGVEFTLKKIGERANLSRKLFPHLLRHTTATDCLNKGMDVNEIQKMLGHENISTTMIYAQTKDQDVKHKHEKLLA